MGKIRFWDKIGLRRSCRSVFLLAERMAEDDLRELIIMVGSRPVQAISQNRNSSFRECLRALVYTQLQRPLC